MQEVMKALDIHYPIFFLLCFFSVHIFSGGLWTHCGRMFWVFLSLCNTRTLAGHAMMLYSLTIGAEGYLMSFIMKLMKTHRERYFPIS
jgi:hypothetical protein